MFDLTFINHRVLKVTQYWVVAIARDAQGNYFMMPCKMDLLNIFYVKWQFATSDLWDFASRVWMRKETVQLLTCTLDT
jgi:hypothetical protein